MGEIHLSDAEWEIMNCLWNKPNQKISQIVIALSEKKAWDKHTVITLLNRMEKKIPISLLCIWMKITFRTKTGNIR